MKKKLSSILFHRSVVVGVAVAAQIVVFAAMILVFSEHTSYFYWAVSWSPSL